MSGGVAVATGALLGLAWGAGFRAYMSELVGAASTFDWAGTFGALLLPATLTGAALGWAEHLRRRGGPPNRRWLFAAPLILAIAPLLLPGAIPWLLRTGQGTGAWWVVLTGLLGGYAMSGRGSRIGRGLAGIVFVVSIAGLVSVTSVIGGPAVGLGTARGAWVGTLALAFTTLLALGCSIPLRTCPEPHRGNNLP